MLRLVARGPVERARSPRRSCVSEHTVKTHVAHILDKLDLRDRVQAVVLAYESGLVEARRGRGLTGPAGPTTPGIGRRLRTGAGRGMLGRSRTAAGSRSGRGGCMPLDERVAVIGLGYVGLPLAIAFAELGLDVLGIDVSERRVDELRARRSPIDDISDERLGAALDGSLTVVDAGRRAFRRSRRRLRVRPDADQHHQGPRSRTGPGGSGATSATTSARDS